MTALFVALLASLRATIRPPLELTPEILALRYQLAVLQRTTPKRPRLRPIDRLLWILLSSVWPDWRQAVQFVTPATVVRWHRRAFAAVGGEFPVMSSKYARTNCMNSQCDSARVPASNEDTAWFSRSTRRHFARAAQLKLLLPVRQI